MNQSVLLLSLASRSTRAVVAPCGGRRLVAFTFLAVITAATAVAKVPVSSDILVVGDVTAAGRAVAPASPEHPVYYEPMWAGFRELGAVAAGEREPPLESAKQALTDALRKRGYVPASSGTPPPTVMIFFAWGTLNPDLSTSVGSGMDGQDETISFNSAQMLGFLGAHKVATLSEFSADRDRVASAAREDQYFLAVAAYDRDSVYQRKRKLLWMTRIATDALRVWLPSVLPAMVAGGAPFFGKDTDLPVWVDPAGRFKAEVDMAPLQFENYNPDEPKAPPRERKP